MPWQTFIDQCRLRGRDFYILWQSQFDFDVDDRVLCDAAERILAFGSADEARAFAANRAKNVQEDGRQVFDLDAVREWCREPDAIARNAPLLWRSWHLLRDSGVAAIPLALHGEEGHPESEIFDNLLLWATSNGSESDERYKRQWRPDEIRSLARILGEAVEKFETRLSMAIPKER
jgi:hypothetical protein